MHYTGGSIAQRFSFKESMTIIQISLTSCFKKIILPHCPYQILFTIVNLVNSSGLGLFRVSPSGPDFLSPISASLVASFPL